VYAWTKATHHGHAGVILDGSSEGEGRKRRLLGQQIDGQLERLVLDGRACIPNALPRMG
jgi:hypothetical protein